MFRMLGDPTRLAIVLSCMDEPVSVSDIAASLEISQSLASHHLRLLRATRLVRNTRRGRSTLYQINDEHVRTMLANMVEHTQEDLSEQEGINHD